MGLAFVWNVYAAGKEINWQLASQSTAAVYLGADGAFLQAKTDAQQMGKLRAGGYWSLNSSIDPKEQAKLFLARIGEVRAGDMPPAVWVYDVRQTQAAKAFVEALEPVTKRRTLIGGTPESLARVGLILGRTNPLWISHKPIWGGPKLPAGWERFALWQSNPNGHHKGIDGEVGINGANTWFLDEGKEKKLLLGLGALAVGAGALYLYTKDDTK
jgi:hypothetical protein